MTEANDGLDCEQEYKTQAKEIINIVDTAMKDCRNHYAKYSECLNKTKVDMKERPIVFSGPMVKAILDGRKTQMRWVVKPQPDGMDKVYEKDFRKDFGGRRNPHGEVGDRVLVLKSRITLEITGVRVERLQESITHENILAEGWSVKDDQPITDGSVLDDAGEWFKNYWNSINGKKYPWESNPWVWVIEFKVISGEDKGDE